MLKTKNSKIILITLIICLISIPLLSCGSDSEEEEENQIVTVQQGDLSVEITAVGNLSLSYTEDLAFEIAGTVQEVMVEAGDTITEGQILVTLDTSEWDDEIKTLEKKLVTTERALVAAERQVAAKELAVRQAELNLQESEDNVYQLNLVKEAKEAVEKAEYYLNMAKLLLKSGSDPGHSYWEAQVTDYEIDLEKAEEELQEILKGTSARVTTDIALDIIKCQLQIEQYQRQLEDARIAVEDALTNIKDAQEDVDDAQEALDEARNSSPIISAPFTGFVTKVNVKGGDEVMKGKVAIQIADPDKFEADILVSEIDIFSVGLGGKAWVEVDALSGMRFSASVTHISPTAIIQSGIVNYTVRVELQSMEAMQQERQARRESMQDSIREFDPEQMEERLKQAVEGGMMTQEQADALKERMEQMREGGFTFPQGDDEDSSFRQGTEQLAPVVTQNVQLREGLTVTVSIVVDEVNNALLIPNSAITYQGVDAYVKVTSSDGVVEDRLIKTGITDYEYTEVTEGLSEGEQIIVPKGTTTSTSTSSQQRAGGMRIPGMGVFR